MAYCLNLPLELAIHDVFHAYLLMSHYILVPSHPVPIIVTDIDAEKYEIEGLIHHYTKKYSHTMKV